MPEHKNPFGVLELPDEIHNCQLGHYDRSALAGSYVFHQKRRTWFKSRLLLEMTHREYLASLAELATVHSTVSTSGTGFDLSRANRASLTRTWGSA